MRASAILINSLVVVSPSRPVSELCLEIYRGLFYSPLLSLQFISSHHLDQYWITRLPDTAMFNNRWTRTVCWTWCWGRTVLMRLRRCWARNNDGLNRWLMTLMKSGRAAPYRCDRKRLVVIIVFLCPVTYNLQKLLALLLLLWTLCNLICLAYKRWLLIFLSLPSSFPQKRWRERGRNVYLYYRILFLCLICPLP